MIALLLLGFLLPAQGKEVTDRQGRTIDLRFLRWNGNVMEVETPAKERRVVAIQSISEKDQDWVRKWVRHDLKLAPDINNRTFTMTDGKKVKADLIGLMGKTVRLQKPGFSPGPHNKGKQPEVIEIPIAKLTPDDQFFVVRNAPMLGSLNANPVTRQHPDAIAAAAAKVDDMMAAFHRAQGAKGQKPNPIVNDSVFVRRAYLVIIGRVPTLDEVNSFLQSDAPNKRDDLVDALFEHEGYVHRMFNYWADLLRIKTRLPGRNYGAATFAKWVKDNVRENKPYDEMVTEMLSAKGYYWDDPAVGFYRRDLNMPLDNLAVMCQTLLGTSIVCAQCHDHPFDTWTQKEYYEMAAYTYPMVTRLPQKDVPVVKDLTALAKKEEGKNYKEFTRDTRRAFQQMVQYPLQSGVRETTRRLQYPKDYAYANAKPKAQVQPSTPFGGEAVIADLKRDSTIEPFVNWFVSPENPRFARNIANRMWKEMFGLGLMEPVDDIKADSESFYPALMDGLADMLIDLQFDLKAFQRVLARTKYFQRAAYWEDVNPVDGYPMTGPLLRRMSAEQMWDSFMALIVKGIDSRHNDSLLKQDNEIAEVGKKTLRSKPGDLYAKLKDAVGKDYRMQQNMVMNSMVKDEPAKKKFVPPKRPKKMNRQEYKEMVHEARVKVEPYYAYGRNLFRSSELPSPAPGGHFLNMFGQSDREITENDNQEASIPQVLTLMNDEKMLNQIIHTGHSELRKAVMAAKTPREKLDTLFLSTFARKATGAEAEVLLDGVSAGDPQEMRRILWAILNSQEFRFIQ